VHVQFLERKGTTYDDPAVQHIAKCGRRSKLFFTYHKEKTGLRPVVSRLLLEFDNPIL